MATYKTPGVYIEEISTLPASIAPVATAIPAFIGYTEDSTKNDESVENIPVRITSMLEFIEIFGGPFKEEFAVTLTGASSSIDDTSIAITHNECPYTLYYHLKMYFGNGGGPCYIVSVGKYAATASAASIDATELKNGLDTVKQEDEVTLLVIPEAMELSSTDRKSLYDAMLSQCNELMDRFCIFDVLVDSSQTVYTDGNNFRNNDVSSNYLKYGAAYYPSIKSTLNKYYEEDLVAVTDSRTGASYTGTTDLSDIKNGKNNAVAAVFSITITDNSTIDGDSFTINGKTITEAPEGSPIPEGSDAIFTKGTGTATTAAAIVNALNEEDFKDSAYSAERPGNAGSTIVITATTAGAAGNSINPTYTPDVAGQTSATITQTTVGSDGEAVDKTLYNSITKELKKYLVTLYPSATMAGIYAFVDNDRGVWKAPANVSIAMVKEPTVLVTHDEQKTLNVDATSGKSINAIRKFAGKGILVWGARTLAGNDNEWRYVPVRRLYIFIEESVKKATEFVVFEPNDAKTWLRVKTMIENFLTILWKQGALAGAKPEHAFFVKVGLGETMTSQDILEGRMNIEIGLAAVRPAEFIILKFSHKLQES